MIKFHQLVWGLALAATALSLAACDDTTDNIGGSLIDNPDKLTVKADTFQLSTRTIMADSVIARNITGSSGTKITRVTKCSHDMSLSSTRLVGGPNNANQPILLSVIHSTFNGR